MIFGINLILILILIYKKMTAPDTVPTPQFDSLYALSHATLSDIKEYHDLYRVLGHPVPMREWTRCGWCTKSMVGAVFWLECQQCREPRQVCYVCRNLSKSARGRGEAATLCVLALKGCRHCRFDN